MLVSVEKICDFEEKIVVRVTQSGRMIARQAAVQHLTDFL